MESFTLCGDFGEHRGSLLIFHALLFLIKDILIVPDKAPSSAWNAPKEILTSFSDVCFT